MLILCCISYGRDLTTLQPSDPANGGWVLQITGQDANDTGAHDDFKSVCIIPGAGTTPAGDTWREDQIYTVVERVIDGNTVTTIELFTPVDWGSEPNYCWFVDCVSGDRLTRYQPGSPAIPGSGTPAYPTLRVADGTFAAQQADPGLTHTLAVADVTDLQNMNNNKAGNYYLTGNIDASATSTWNAGAGFVPIGTSASRFTGTLDGCGYTISGLVINRGTTANVGLFGYIRSAKIANLTLANCSIRGSGSGLGSLIGTANNTTAISLIQNCHTSGTVTIGGTGVAVDTGGMIGVAAGGTDFEVRVYDCTTSCTVDGETAYTGSSLSEVGGFVGSSDDGSWFTNCRATGNVTTSLTQGQRVGGFAGYVDGSGLDTNKFIDCSATGNVQGENDVGGFIGAAAAVTVLRCSARGNVTTDTGTAGGFAAWISGTVYSSFTDFYAWGNVVSNGVDAAGLIGYVSSATTFTNAYSIGTLTVGGGTTYGGLIADDPSSMITACFWDTEASGIATSDGGVGHITSWMQTKSNYDDASWDTTTVWYIPETAPGTPAVAEAWLTHDGTQLDGESVCVYADAAPRGSFTMDGNDISGFTEADYSVVIAGLNYWSKLETLPIIVAPEPNAIISDKQIMAIRFDFDNTYSLRYGMGADSTPQSWTFNGINSSVFKLERGTFPYGSRKKATVYVDIWDPVPLGIRMIAPEVTFWRPK